MSVRLLPLTFLAGLVACGSSSKGDGDEVDAGDQTAEPDANLEGFVELISGDWTAAPGDEPYHCARLTVAEDTYITAFKDLSPLGTHHTVLSVGDPQGPDGEFACGVGTNFTRMLFASGVGSDAFEFPAGVALKVAAGQQLNLNLHLYNAGTEPLAGHSASLVKLTPAGEIGAVEEAELILAGTFLVNLPPTGEPHTVHGECEIDTPGTVLNLWPHMHQLGTHMVVRHNETVKLDEAYDFEEQINWPTEFAIAAGDRIEVDCTYVNDTGSTVTWGESSDQEMCFAGFYRYPAAGRGFCGDGF